MMRNNEEFRPVPGYEGRYEISNLGRVKSLPRMTRHSEGRTKKVPGRFLAQAPSKGYLTVRLYREQGAGITNLVHRILAMAFISAPPFDGAHVNHIDGNRLNNEASNLEWCTHLQNTRHAISIGLFKPKGQDASRAKLTNEQVLEIRRRYKPFDPVNGGKPLAKEFGVSNALIGNIAARRYWTHI